MRLKHILIVALSIFAVSCVTESGVDTTPKETISTIHSRKSVRTFTDQSVDRELLIEIVRAGMAAPSSMDRRPWEFIIVDDRAILNLMAGRLPYAKMLVEAPVAIVVCGNTNPNMGGSSNWYLDCSAAAQNILLATEALGLGGRWTAAFPYQERMTVVGDALDLPENIEALCVIPIGHPTGAEKPKDKYNAEKIRFNRW